MKYIVSSLVLLALFGTSCKQSSVSEAPISTDRAEPASVHAVLSASQARKALADFVTAHPEVFVSPGPYESTTNILQSSVGSDTSGQIQISRFNVNLDAKTYQLSYHFESPDIDFWEKWLWEGSFSRAPNGEWKVEQPTFKKFWGK